MSTASNHNFGQKSKRVVNEATAKWSNLLLKVAQQDRAAFEQLFIKFSPLIKAFANKQAGADKGVNLSEELVQETMVKVWQKADSFNPDKASASTWIFTIARNTRIDLLRKNARHFINKASAMPGNDMQDDGFDVDDIWIENEEEDIFNQLVKQRNSEALHESMKALPQEQSFILKKVYLEDKSHSEIAEELQMPLGTVKSRVRLALNKLSLSVDR